MWARAHKPGESYYEGERLQTPQRLNYGTAQDPLPICEEEELTRTEITKRVAMQRDRSSDGESSTMAPTPCTCGKQRRGNHTDQRIRNRRQRVWRTERKVPGEAATLSTPDKPFTTRSDPDLRKDPLLRGNPYWRHPSLQLATPRFSSSGLTDVRLAVV